jgi:hypothetical protein
VEVRISVPGLPSSLNGVVPGGGTAIDDSGTPLQRTRFVTRWDYKGDAYYVEATLDGTEGGITYGAGKVSVDEGVFNVNPTATMGNTYAPLLAATGSVRRGEITIRVPAASVGGAAPGDNVYSVGTYAIVGRVDGPIGVLQSLPITLDSTPTFDTALKVLPAAESGSESVTVTASAPGKAPEVGAPAVPVATAPTPVAAPGEPADADSSGFSKTAAVTTGGAAALVALLAAGALVRRRRRTG